VGAVGEVMPARDKGLEQMMIYLLTP